MSGWCLSSPIRRSVQIQYSVRHQAKDYIYQRVCVCLCVYIYTYIYIYLYRTLVMEMYIHICVYIYIFLFIFSQKIGTTKQKKGITTTIPYKQTYKYIREWERWTVFERERATEATRDGPFAMGPVPGWIANLKRTTRSIDFLQLNFLTKLFINWACVLHVDNGFYSLTAMLPANRQVSGERDQSLSTNPIQKFGFHLHFYEMISAWPPYRVCTDGWIMQNDSFPSIVSLTPQTKVRNICVLIWFPN